MRILVSYRGIPQSPGWSTGDMAVKAFRALGHEVYQYAKYYQEARWIEDPSRLLREEYDLSLFMECNDGDSQYTELRSIAARKTACWFFDTSYHKDRYTRLVDYMNFDHIFLANPLTIGEYNTWGYKNVHYLPYACDTELHFRPIGEKHLDIVLVGSIRDDRTKLKNDLANQNINLDLIDGKFREDYINTLASARFIINQNPQEGRGLLNMRYFESQAAGSTVLTEESDYYINYPELKIDMEPFIDTPYNAFPYAHINDLTGTINILMDHPTYNEKDKIKRQELFMKKNTYQNRCEQILENIFPNG